MENVIQVAVLYTEDQDTQVIISSLLSLGANGFVHLVCETGEYVIVSKDEVESDLITDENIDTICKVEAEQEYGTDGIFRFHTNGVWVEVVQ